MATKKKNATAKKVTPAKKASKMSLLDAAVKVLGENKQPMHVKEIVEAAVKKGYWTPGKGKTPAATLASSLLPEMAKGKEARVKKAGRGEFATGHSPSRLVRHRRKSTSGQLARRGHSS